jgi:hypothetical protein
MLQLSAANMPVSFNISDVIKFLRERGVGEREKLNKYLDAVWLNADGLSRTWWQHRTNMLNKLEHLVDSGLSKPACSDMSAAISFRHHLHLDHNGLHIMDWGSLRYHYLNASGVLGGRVPSDFQESLITCLSEILLARDGAQAAYTRLNHSLSSTLLDLTQDGQVEDLRRLWVDLHFSVELLERKTGELRALITQFRAK